MMAIAVVLVAVVSFLHMRLEVWTDLEKRSASVPTGQLQIRVSAIENVNGRVKLTYVLQWCDRNETMFTRRSMMGHVKFMDGALDQVGRCRSLVLPLSYDFMVGPRQCPPLRQFMECIRDYKDEVLYRRFSRLVDVIQFEVPPGACYVTIDYGHGLRTNPVAVPKDEAGTENRTQLVTKSLETAED
jgi:hypothetical protein